MYNTLTIHTAANADHIERAEVLNTIVNAYGLAETIEALRRVASNRSVANGPVTKDSRAEADQWFGAYKKLDALANYCRKHGALFKW